MLNITVNGTTLTANLAGNSSAQALRDWLTQGPVTVQMHDYAGMEKVGPLGRSLPTNNEQIDTVAGDIILYQGNRLGHPCPGSPHSRRLPLRQSAPRLQ